MSMSSTDATCSSSGSRPAKKQKSKRKYRRRSEEEKKRILEGAIEDAKKDFEELRDKTLAEIPENYKSMFGQIGFTKFGKLFLPVLVLSPFSISPSQVRDMWFTMFEKLKQNDRIENMSYLIYHYGSDLDDENDGCFSFIPQRAFTSYENGVKNGYDKLPKNIQKKVDGSGKLRKADSNVIQTLEEMREGLKKEPKERRGKLDDVREGYEMLSMSDVDDLSDASEEEERLESEDELLGDEEFSETEIKQKKQDRRSSKTAKKKAAAKKDESVSKAGEDGLLDAIVTEVGEIEDIGDIEASEEDEKDDEEEEPLDDKEHDYDRRDESKQKPKGPKRKKKKVSEISHKKESIESEDELFFNEEIEETKTEQQKRAAQNPFQSDDDKSKDDNKEAQQDDIIRRILTRWNAQNRSQSDDDASKDDNEEAKQDDVVRRIDALENKMHSVEASVNKILTLLKGDKSGSS